MRKFSEVYDKAKDVFKNQKFEDDWHKYLTERTSASKLFGGTWLNQAYSSSLDDVRRKLNYGSEYRIAAAAKWLTGQGRDAAEEIFKAAGENKDNKRRERAATLKLMKHFYLIASRGGQEVWVFSPPEAYTDWVYDELNVGEATLKAKLKKDEEIFTEKQKQIMSHALQFAHAWCQSASAKLAGADAKVLAVVKRWFADQNSDDDDVKEAAKTLSEGFKKMANMANSTNVVFSDDPKDRAEGGQKWFKNYRALVYPSEAKPVIYLEGLWLKEANGVTSGRDQDQMWNLSRTIIHELSHKAVGTDDVCYAGHTLNPDANAVKRNGKKLDAGKALTNADSWAYFCVDLMGVLPSSRKDQVLAAAA